MASSMQFSSFSIELRTIQAKNIDFISSGDLFVRYYLSAGNGKRIQLNTNEISCKSEFHWNESFSLDCFGSKESMCNLEEDNLVLELRRRCKTPVFKKIYKSQLLGRAEIPWKSMFESPNVEMEKWVALVPSCSVPKDVKPPAVRVAMKLRVPAIMVKNVKEAKLNKKLSECYCNEIRCSCSGNEIFALEAALEGL